MLLLVARGSHGALAVLDDAAHLGEALLPVGEIDDAQRQLLALRLKARHGMRVARNEVAEHRHRLQRIALLIDRQQKAKVAQAAEAVEGDETAGEELLLLRNPRLERGHLGLQLPLLRLELRLHANREVELARADP